MSTAHETREAILQAIRIIDTADDMAALMCRALVGRLRQADDVTSLRRLKAELRDFDMTTGKWKP